MDLVRDALRTWLAGVELDRVEAESVVLAAWEACANAIEHALEPTGDTVTISARREGSSVLVTVSDTGLWVPPSEGDGRGLGLRLIESLSTASDITTSESGTTVTIRRELLSGTSDPPGS
jgi:anti-sigma regulatory factor (Ser/Thr protein kinase)